MDEWWTYSLSDFMLFSSATFFRQFELYNEALWPLHLAAIGLGGYIAKSFYFDGARKDLQNAAFLALGWIWVAMSYFGTRHAEINPTASFLAVAFGGQTILFILAEYMPNTRETYRGADHLRNIGSGFILFGVFLYPMVGFLAGRPWMQAEVFGVLPNPTVFATLGILLVAPRFRGLLLAIPLAWCAIDGAMRYAMEVPDFWVMPAAGLLTLVLVVHHTIKRRVRSI